MNESIHKYFRVGALQWMSFPDKASLVEPAPYAAKFGAEMRMTHNNFGLLVDLSHIPVTPETSQFVFRTLRPYITHLKIRSIPVCQRFFLISG